jgi:hypothetical protein
MSRNLVALGWHIFGGSHGHHGRHGLRLFILVVIAAAVVVGLVLLVRHWRARRPPQDAVQPDDWAAVRMLGGTGPESPKPPTPAPANAAHRGCPSGLKGADAADTPGGGVLPPYPGT